jgi:hypothetical protein
VDENWLDWYGDIAIDISSDESGFPGTILLASAIGIPLVYVGWVLIVKPLTGEPRQD